MALVTKDDGFEQQLRESMRSAPWLAVSALLHLLVIVVLSQFDYSRAEDAERLAIVATARFEEVEVLPLTPPEVEPVEPKVVDEIDDRPIVEVDPSDFPAQLPVEGPPSPIRGLVDVVATNDVIGVGPGRLGGGGGPSGTPRGPRGRPPAKSEIAVRDGLVWLSRHQDPTGFWDSDGFPSRCEQTLCDGKGGALNDVGATALATLAFLGEGNTVDAGPHSRVVRSALRWLQSVQDPDDGCVGTKAGQHFMYGHALATLALTEGYHLSRMPGLRAPAQRALDFVSRARNPYAAWRYAYPPDGDNDVSISGWMLFALYAGKDAGLQVDDGAIAQGMNWVRSLADPATGRTGYHERGSPPAREPDAIDRWPAQRSESMTACALLLDCFDGIEPASAGSDRRTDLVLAQRPRWDEDAGSIDFYFWYYGSYAMWQVGGGPWEQWQKSLLPAVVDHQRKEGCELGSWDPQVDPWGREGGRVYSTAINVLSLQVYYRHARLFGAR